MTIEDVRRALRSDEPLVVVEAPAGCGKTYEAIGAAVDLAKGIAPHQEVLLLAHTNAAVQVFRQRARAQLARVHASTLDAFAFGLIGSYAAVLNLPAPLHPGQQPGDTPFTTLAPKLCELFQRAPSIARAVAGHYPVLILDEHQDSRVDQYRAVEILASTGRCRVRVFGDPMQAIYGFEKGELVDWAGVCGKATSMHTLREPHRWHDAAKLGEWIVSARTQLRNGGLLPLTTAPAEVKVCRIADLGSLDNPNSSQVVQALARPLQEVLAAATGTIAVLARTNAHVLGLRRTVRRRLAIDEGADLPDAYRFVSHARECAGKPKDLALLVVDILSATCAGMDRAKKLQITKRLHDDDMHTRRAGAILPFLTSLQPIYDHPDLVTWCTVVGAVGRHPPEGVKVDCPAIFRILGTLKPTEGEDPRDRLDALLRYRRDVGSAPPRCVSTIHKAKGREFDHVVIVPCSGKSFNDTPDARQVLYVALSRAKQSITLIVPRENPSPLLHFG
ncbi:MAG: UvrD-helicase domain-containing protein [Chloroflexota bacterium]|nr:UvrD-helicase domain-containing protein [Chloroflexota bacterium]